MRLEGFGNLLRTLPTSPPAPWSMAKSWLCSEHSSGSTWQLLDGAGEEMAKVWKQGPPTGQAAPVQVTVPRLPSLGRSQQDRKHHQVC